MNSADIIIGVANVVAQLAVAGVAVWAVLASLHATKGQIKENRYLATEERQHSSRPIIAPKKEMCQTTAYSYDMNTRQTTGERLYTSDHLINWAYSHPVRISLENIGNGPAFNLHAVLYGSGCSCSEQFVSWDNGPVEARGQLAMELEHSAELRLLHNESADGKHPLYDRSPDSSENPWASRIACLTLTYHDLFGKKYASIYHYTLQHQWIHVATREISEDGLFDLKELNDRRKRGLKLSESLS